METLINLVCEKCGIEFTRRLSEHKRTLRRGASVYCSRKCSGNIERIPKEIREQNLKLLNQSGRPAWNKGKRDKYTPLRSIYRKAKDRCSKSGMEFAITLDNLYDIYVKQDGCCVYSGVKLTPSGNHTWNINKVSIDRIDSSKGYTIDNVQLVSLAMNYCKNRFSHDEMIALCKQIASHWSDKE